MKPSRNLSFWHRYFRRNASLPPDTKPDLESGAVPAAGGIDGLSDEEFVDFCYRRLLEREADPGGKALQVRFLAEGNPRAALILNFLDSREYARNIVKSTILSYVRALPIIDERPGDYGIVESLSGQGKVRVFRAASEADFDWLERKILDNEYYERPGVWGFEIDEDKRMMARIASFFAPARVLDFGCSNGGVLKCLYDLGIAAEGVEISSLALSKAFPEILGSIRVGDLLGLGLGRDYDLVMGLDIFEHLNPRKLGIYLARLGAILRDGGFLLANIPAFGKDEIFGEIFPMDLPGWAADAAAGRPFRSVPVDDFGYPRNGHLIGAEAGWWVARFAEHGFARETEIERALHRAFDAAMDGISPARKAYFVFSRNAPLSSVRAVVGRISG